MESVSLTLDDDPVTGEQGGPDGDQDGTLGVVAEHVARSRAWRFRSGGSWTRAECTARVREPLAWIAFERRELARRAAVAFAAGLRATSFCARWLCGRSLCGRWFCGPVCGRSFCAPRWRGRCFCERSFCGPLWLGVCSLWWQWWWRVAFVFPLSSSAAGARVSVRVVFDYPRVPTEHMFVTRSGKIVTERVAPSPEKP